MLFKQREIRYREELYEFFEWKTAGYRVFSIPLPLCAKCELIEGRFRAELRTGNLTVSGFLVSKDGFHGKASVIVDIIEGYQLGGFKTASMIENHDHFVVQKMKGKGRNEALLATAIYPRNNNILVLNFAFASIAKILKQEKHQFLNIVSRTDLNK